MEKLSFDDALARTLVEDAELLKRLAKHDTTEKEAVPPASHTERFFLAQDESCHWYIVPCAKQKEWSAWRDLSEDDEASWDAPDWAICVGGAPSLVTFERPEIA